MKDKIDFTILEPGILDKRFEKLCSRSKGFRGVCVYPTRTFYARSLTDSKIISVIGFPFGLQRTKLEAAKSVLKNIDELAVVWNMDDFTNRRYLSLSIEINRIVELGVPVKVITPGIEHTDYKKITIAYHIALDSGAFCIETLTKNPEMNFYLLETWRELEGLKVKVAGGIDTYNMAKRLIDAGADIIGTSHSLKIVAEEKRCR